MGETAVSVQSRCHYARTSRSRSAPQRSTMTELARLYAQIALLQRGPQDIPASMLVLAATVLGYFVINFAVSVMLPPFPGPWLGHLVVETLFTLAWYAVLLRISGRPERFAQTSSAIFGYQAVLAPIWIACMWMVSRVGKDSTWQLPVVVLSIVLFLWVVTVNTQILRAALEWPTIVGYLIIAAVFPAPR
jgi:hypothetical protein